MAGEEVLKGPGALGGKAGGGAGGPPSEKPPADAAVPGAEVPKEPEKPPGGEEEAKKPKRKTEKHDIPADRLEELTKKLAESSSEAARKILGGEKPRNLRVFEAVEEMASADEARLVDPAYLRRVGEKLKAIIEDEKIHSPAGREAARYLRRITEHEPTLRAEFHEILDTPIVRLDGLIDNLYADETDPLKDTEVGGRIQQIKRELTLDAQAAQNPKELEHYIQSIRELGAKQFEDPIVREEIGKRLKILQEISAHASVTQLESSRKQRFGERVVRWDDIASQAPKAERERAERIGKEDYIFSDYFGEDEVRNIRNGSDGEADWYFNFIDEIYRLGKEQSHPDLPQMQKFEEFKRYLRWKYGAEYNLVNELYQKHWDGRGTYEYAVKGLLYNPGDVKDRLKAMALLTGADLDHLYKNYEFSNYAASLYEHVVAETLAERQGKYQEAIRFLKEEVDNPLFGKAPPEKKVGKKAIENPNKALYEKRRISREDLLKILREKHAEEVPGATPGETTYGTLTTEEQRMMLEIEAKRDLAAEGVSLWDDDVLSYTEVYLVLEKTRAYRDALVEKLNKGGTLTEIEQEELERANKLYTLYSRRKATLDESYTKELIATRGLSPIDIEVRERLLEYLKTEGKMKGEVMGENGDPPEWKVRMAIWAARTAMIGSGRMAAISAFMSTPARYEYPEFAAPSGKDVMRAPAFEDLVRIFNPEAFAHRFNIGGEMGKTARGILRRNLRMTKKQEAPRGFKVTQTKEWKERFKTEKHPEMRYAMEVMEFAEQNTGISFTELLGPGFLSGGGQMDGSAWRIDKGAAEQVRNKVLEMQKLPDGAQLENQALSIQFLVEKSPGRRMGILERMMRRNPSKFLSLLRDDTGRILEKRGITKEEWGSFQGALSLAEVKLYDDKRFSLAKMDLAKKEDFDAVIVPFLRTRGVPEGRFEALRGVLVDMQEELTKRRDTKIEGIQYKSILEAIANEALPLTLSLTDFNWKDVNFFQLGSIAMHRRIRDIGNQMETRDGILAFMSEASLMSPNDPVETIKHFYKIRAAINNYVGTPVSEPVMKELARVFIEFNRHRSLRSVGWVPGLSTLMKHAHEIDARDWKDNKLLNKLTNGRWHNIAEKRVSHWPHSIAQAISYSVRYTGSEGNAWDEFKIQEVINTMEDMGLFTDKPELAHDLRKEFKTTLNWRMLAMARKYWWVLVAATIAVAAEKAIAEEEKKGGH